MAFLDEFPKLATYPTLVKVVGEDRIRKSLTELRENYFNPTKPLHQKKRGGYSRGFWNSLAIAAFEDKPGRLAVATFFIDAIEAGLKVAAQANKERKFKDALIGQDPNFVQTVAELYLLGKIGPLATSIDLELPGRVTTKNYDFHFVIDGHEVHADSKWRTPTGVGEIINGAEAVIELEGLLRPGFDAVAVAYVATNRLSTENVWDIAFIVDEIRRFIRGNFAGGKLVNGMNVSTVVKGEAYNWAASCLINGNCTGHAGTAHGARFVFIPAYNVAYVESELVERVEFKKMLPEGANGTCILMPKSETQVVYESSEPGDRGDQPAEHKGIETLLADVTDQLPAAPYNVVVLGLQSYEYFEDAELAVLGTPDGSGRRGGKFAETAFKDISGVLAFSMIPPNPERDAPRAQLAKYWANDNCPDPLPEAVAEKMRAALGDDPGDVGS